LKKHCKIGTEYLPINKDKNTDSKDKYFKNMVVDEYPGPNRYRLREKELLAKEIAEELRG
jgi:hypothetical protein